MTDCFNHAEPLPIFTVARSVQGANGMPISAEKCTDKFTRWRTFYVQ